MAPAASLLTSLLLVGGAIVEAKPLWPGRHANPHMKDLLSTVGNKRSHQELAEKYYGAERGLAKPAKLNSKRATIPAGWTYDGCRDESWNERLLQGTGFSSSSMTPQLCMNFCQNAGYSHAGMEYSDECYCGNAYVGSGGTKEADSSCNSACAGDSTSMCGGSWMLSVYQYNGTTGGSDCSPASVSPVLTTATTATTTAATAATTTATATTTNSAAYPVHTDGSDMSEWYSLGCAVDSINNRVLNAWSQTGIGAMTVDWCLSTCEDKGYSFAGVEYGQECYCGNGVPSTITYNENNCNMACTGDASETCGGGNALELYELVSSAACSVNAAAVVPTTSLMVNNNLVMSIPPRPQKAATTTTADDVTVPTRPATTAAATTPATTAPTTTIVVPTTTAAVSPAATTVAASNGNVPSASGDHSVWAHHMVGNTYPYSQNDWANDIRLAVAAGIDGFALNMGSDWWQPDRINDAYTAAQNSGTGFKLFLSLDMTVMGCWSGNDANTLVNLVSRWAKHPNQALHNGKVLVSTFAGSDCNFGIGSNNGWQTLFVNPLKNNGVNIFFVPSIFSDVSTFAGNSWMDGELNWNSGWPMGDWDLTTASDVTYMNALSGKEYMAAVSPFFYTHFGANSWNKNWLYRSDDWLYCTRWEQLIAMRNQIKQVEILTWNDYGESSYIGPIAGAMPAGSEAWVNGYDHQGLNVLTNYYATAYKTGAYPTITKDSIIMWSRPHTAAANAWGDSAGKPTGWNWTDDNLYAVVLTTGPATVTLTSGSSSQTFSVSGGLTKLKIPSQLGGIGGSIARNGQTTATYTGSMTYTNNPQTYNYNYYVGSSS